MMLIAFVLLLLCLIGLSWFAGSDAPYVPTKNEVLKKALTIAKVKAGDHFYELGSGDGRVVIMAAQMGATAYGIEQSWIRVWSSRIWAYRLGLKNVHFLHGNIFSRQYYPADIVYVYLLQPAIDRLEKKLRQELKPGAIVITQTYHFKKWPPYKTDGNFQYYRVASK